jgi:hypothetical protein
MADVKQILIEIDVQTGDVVGGIANVNKQLSNLGATAKVTNKEITKAAKAMQTDLAGSAGIAGAAATELGRTISDLPFGLTAVTNNISQLGNMFALLVSNTKSVGGALTALGSVLRGPVGILVAFQAAVAGVEMFAQSQRKAKKDVDNLKDSIEEINKMYGNQRALLIALGDAAMFGTESQRKALAENMKEVKAYLEAAETVGEITPQVIDEAIKLGLNLIEARKNAAIAEKEYLEAVNASGRDRSAAAAKFAEASQKVVDAEKALILQKQEEVVVTAKLTQEKEKEIAVRERSISAIIREGARAVASFRNAYIQRRVAQEAEVRDDESFLEWKATFFENLSNKESFSFEERTAYYRQYVMATQQLGDVQLRNEQIKLSAMEQINLSYANSLGSIFKIISDLGGESRFLQAVALIGESAAGIAKIVISTKAANLAARAKYALLPPIVSKPLIAAETSANNFAAKVGIAANIASTAKAVSALKAPVSTPSAASVGSEPLPPSGAPQFNVVGAAGQNQLAAAIAGTQQQPVKAYVVSSDVTTAQQLDRNIIQSASI